eukprot:2744853-Rhodomonas_salina.1
MVRTRVQTGLKAKTAECKCANEAHFQFMASRSPSPLSFFISIVTQSNCQRHARRQRLEQTSVPQPSTSRTHSMVTLSARSITVHCATRDIELRP